VGTQNPYSWKQTFQQKRGKANIELSFFGISSNFIILGKPSVIIDPIKRKLNSPPFGKNFPLGLDSLGNIDGFAKAFNVFFEGSPIPGIGANAFE
jgi:hypothetical protein